MKKGLSRRSFLKTMGATAVLGGMELSGLSKVSRSHARSGRYRGLPRLTYIFPGSPQSDLGRVQDALNEYLAERIGATIDLRAVEWGAFDQQIGLINASAEDYDLAFTAPWINNYYANISQEYLAPIEDLLPELAPNYWASLTPVTWEAARVKGSIYGAINQQIFVKPFGPYIRTDILEAVGVGEAFASITRYEDLEPILAAIKEYAEQDDVLEHVTYGLGSLLTPENSGYDVLDGFLVVKGTDESAQVVIFSETDEYRQAAELAHSWYQAGYVPADIVPWDQIDAQWSAGLYAMRISDIVKPGGNAEVEARWGQPVTSKALVEPLLTTAGVTATMNSISSLSGNIELAVQYLELVNSDPVFYNTLCKGLEGIHWEWVDQEKLLIKPAGDAASFADTGWNPNTDWMFGNVFNSYYSDSSQIGAWPETASLNQNARPSPVLGFTFDRSKVETEIASIAAVSAEFADPLGSGFIDPEEGISQLNEVLKAAGIERVQEELQRQIDDWKSS